VEIPIFIGYFSAPEKLKSCWQIARYSYAPMSPMRDEKSRSAIFQILNT